MFDFMEWTAYKKIFERITLTTGYLSSQPLGIWQSCTHITNAGGLMKVDFLCRVCICQTKDVVTNCIYNFLVKFH